MTPVRRALLVGSGGFAGGAARAAAAMLLVGTADAQIPVAAALLAVNLSGSVLAGFLRGRLAREQAAGGEGATLDALLLVGFCGGFTSYSGFVSAAVEGSGAVVVATLVLCPCAALLGMLLSGGYPARPAGNPR